MTVATCTAVTRSALAAAHGPAMTWYWTGTGQAMTRHGLRALTAGGATPATAGVLGTATRVERATTNQCTNPSFEVDTAGWGSPGGAAVSRQTSVAAFGAAGGRVTAQAGAGNHYIRNQRPGIASAGQTWTISAYVKRNNLDWCYLGDSAHVAWYRAFFNLASGTVGTQTNATGAIRPAPEAGAGWYRVAVTYTYPSDGLTAIDVAIGLSSGDGGNSFTAAGTEALDFDAVQCEAASAAGSYADGSLGSGYAWSGTAHASVSTRAAGTLSAVSPAFDPHRGAAVVWLRPGWASGATTTRTVLHAYVDADREWRLFYDGASGEWRQRWRDGAASSTVGVAASHAAGADEVVVASWAPGVCDIATRTAVARGSRGVFSAPAGAIALGLGCRGDTGAEPADAVVGPVALLDAAPAPSAVARLRSAHTPPRWPRG